MKFAEVERLHSFEGHVDSVYALCGTGGADFLSAGGEGVVASWQGSSGESLGAVLKAPAALYSLGFAPASALLVAGQADGGIHFFDFSGKRLLRSVQAHAGGVFDFAFPLAGGVLAGGGDGKLSRWSLQGELLATITLSEQPLRALALSPTNDQLAVAGKDGVLWVLDPLSLEIVQQYTAHAGIIMSLAYNADGRFLYSAGRDAHLRMWDRVERYELAQEVVGHTGTIHHLCMSPDGKYLATASMDKSIKLWAPTTLQLLKVIDHRRHGGHTNSVNRLLWLPTLETAAGPLRQLVSCSDDRAVYSWGIRMNEEQR